MVTKGKTKKSKKKSEKKFKKKTLIYFCLNPYTHRLYIYVCLLYIHANMPKFYLEIYVCNVSVKNIYEITGTIRFKTKTNQ